MEKRTFENLTIKEGEKLIFFCDVEIKGNLTINGGILIVAGELGFYNEGSVLTINDGILIVTGKLCLYNADQVFTINGGNVSVGSLVVDSGHTIEIHDSDLYVHGDLKCNSIFSDSDILVDGDSFVHHVSCLNYMVEGNNDSSSITAIQDIYVGGDNYSYELTCRDLYVGGNLDANGRDITVRVSLYVAGGISSCNQIAVG